MRHAIVLLALLAAILALPPRSRASDTAGDYQSIEIHEDFLAGASGSCFVPQTNGAGSYGNWGSDGSATRPGQIEIRTGTTATGRAALILGNGLNSILFGGGEWAFESDIELPGLANPGEDWTLRIGFVDSYQANQSWDGAWFEYDDRVSPNWQLWTSSGGTRSVVTSSVAVSTGWHRFKADANASGTGVEFFLDGASIGLSSLSIPTLTGQTTGAGIVMNKTAGIITRLVRVDWIDVKATLTTAR